MKQDKNLSVKASMAAFQYSKEGEYWLNKFSGELSRTFFFYDHCKECPGQHTKDSVTFELSSSLSAKLIELSKGLDHRLYILLTAGLVALLYKYTGSNDIIVGSPIFKQDKEGDFINTMLPLRNSVNSEMTFKELLLDIVRPTIIEANEHQNYPIETLLFRLNMAVTEEEFPLFDVVVLLENIHEKKYIHSVHPNIVFSFSRNRQGVDHPGQGEQVERVDVTVEYNTSRYQQPTIRRILCHFIHLMEEVAFNINIRLLEIQLLKEEEKKQILYDFNRDIKENEPTAYPANKTLQQLFEDQAAKTPGRTAVCFAEDLSHIHELLTSDTGSESSFKELEACCFNVNPYLVQRNLPVYHERCPLVMLKTNHHNSVIVNGNLVKLLTWFDGETNLKSIFPNLKPKGKGNAFNPSLFLYWMKNIDLLELKFEFNKEPGIYSIETFSGFVSLVQSLHRHHLIDLVGIKPAPVVSDRPGNAACQFSRKEIPILQFNLNERLQGFKYKSVSKADVLLLGDAPGMPSTGLLYLASYLTRNGIAAYCQFYDPSIDYQSLKRNLNELLLRIQPKVVAVSMKWFLYIARVINICGLIKGFSPGIKVVVGGNTASFYWKEIIRCNRIDYVIRGDGEVPLLKICQGEKEELIPNIVFEKEGKIIETPVSFVQDETNAADIYLSHLKNILLSDTASLLGAFYINTHKGCLMNCLYCGGCQKAQKRTFNRSKVFRRGVEEVRKDILEASKFASTLQFDFDVPHENLLDYCQKIWEGIDLSNHFCIFSSLQLPSPELLKSVTQTFKYVYFDIDITTLSQRHREQLSSSGLVKPQPTDNQILAFMDECEKYRNAEVRINLIAGLPCFTREDINTSEEMLSYMTNAYSCFGELHWARLHAQPGAPILTNPEKWQMISYASTFEDFKAYSEKNFDQKSPYPTMEDFQYPYVYYQDDQLNSLVSRFYVENNLKVRQYRESKREHILVFTRVSYEQLNHRSHQLARVLQSHGITPGSIVGIMLEPSTEIITALLAVLKAGCAYLPIDPDYPPGRIDYMLTDSNAKILVTRQDFAKEIKFEKTIVYLSEAINHVPTPHLLSFHPDGSPSPHPHSPSADTASLAYVIYTSGTTGKPKGILVNHQSQVNYVHWFTNEIQLTPEDKSLLTSSFAFDLGYTVVYPTILKGGETHILPRDIYLSPGRLLNYIKEKGITYIKMTPSFFTIVASNPIFSERMCQTLRLAVIGGESINIKGIEKAHDKCRHLKIMNHYGPAEATIGCVRQLIDFHRFEEYKIHPVIGRPIPNTRVYILDRNLNLLPVGIPGELCISGICLAKGYLNRPDLTADKFCLRQPGGTPVSRSPIYLTGDQARWLPDGTIEFLGRIDSQVKIRGYRVELGEIETQLLGHNRIKEVVVVDKEDGNGDRCLCAYFVPRENPGGQQHLQKKLITGKIVKTHRQFRFSDIEINGSKIVKADEPLEVNEDEEEVNSSILHSYEKKVNKYRNKNKIAVESVLTGKVLTFDFLDRFSNQVAQQVLQCYDDGHRLTKKEEARYRRQILLDGWGIESQEKLKGTTVFVAGAGGGASPTITQLALAGIGTIIVCDDDEVELSNLNRQFLHDESRIGMNKALSAQITINRLNPNVNVIPIAKKLTRENVFEWVGESAVIFDMFDDLESKFILSQCAVANQIPHVISAMIDLNSYAVVLHSPKTPCFHCLFDEVKYRGIVEGMKHTWDNYQKNPLSVVASSLFTGTGLVVTETMKILLGFENPSYGKFFLFNLKASSRIIDTDGYKMMTYAFSDHFKKISKDQGFDWEVGFRGQILEELNIHPDPNCPLCGEKGKERLLSLKKSKKSKSTTMIPEQYRPTGKFNQSVALLFDDKAYMTAALLGVLKSGKISVPLAASREQDELKEILEDSQVRLILTDKSNLNLAIKTRNRINKNIAIVNISELDESNTAPEGNLNVFIQPDQAAAVLYHADEPEDISTSSLREYLSQKMPDFMVPAYFVPLEKIPLTANNKIDRNALPEPSAGASRKCIAPRDELEKKLTEIWSDILEIEKEKISMDANFFELGGHSLKVTMMVSKIQKDLNIELPITEVFKTPKIEGLAAYIKKIKKDPLDSMTKKNYHPGWRKDNHDNLTLLKKGKSGINLFFIHDGSGDVDGYLEFCNQLNTGINCWGIKGYKIINYTPLNLTIGGLARDYCRMIKKVQADGPYMIAGWSLGGTIAFEIVRLLERSNDKINLLALIDTLPPPHLNKDLNANKIGFNLKTEVNMIKEYIPGGSSSEILKNIRQIDDIWPTVADYLENNQVNIEIIKHSIPGHIAQIIPNFAQLRIREMFFYLNMYRSFENARNQYIPGDKIKTPVDFFKASETEMELDRWNEFCQQPVKSYKIVGSHFSILRKTDVIAFANIFNKIINDRAKLD